MPDSTQYDLILRHGTLYDGSGAPPVVGDLAIQGQSIAALGDLGTARGRQDLDVSGLAVTPGFINMLSWSTESLIADGRSQSEIRQGVTTEIMGDGHWMGPVNERVREEMLRELKDFHYKVEWSTLADYLRDLDTRRTLCNVAS